MNKIYLGAVIAFFMIICSCNGGGGGTYTTEDLNAHFELDKRSYEVGEEIHFKNTSTGYETVYWDFDNGDNSTAISPVYAYRQPGDYQPSLTITAKNQNKIYRFKITVFGEPFIEADSVTSAIEDETSTEKIIRISTDPSIVAVDTKINYKANTNDTLQWNLDDQMVQINDGGTVKYTTPGAKNIRAFQIGSETPVSETKVQVYKAIVSPKSNTVGGKIKLSAVCDFNVKWDLGDGRIIEEKETEISFDKAGSFSIKLLTGSSDSLLMTSVVNINVKPAEISSAQIDQLLNTLANVGADEKKKDNVTAELLKLCLAGQNTPVGGKETGLLDDLLIKLRLESSRYVRVTIKTDLLLDESGKIKQLNIMDYSKKEI